ncbi:MAG TPA: hypothetical protein VFQ53_26615 [Kofleriaceae bacterium]|nr:hypothetical protein [Kofleriaceae bacterium]
MRSSIIQGARPAILALAIIAGITSLDSLAFADEISKEVCLDSHSRGQDARDQNKLSLARKLFLTCAQPSCPTLVQGDCARFADDLARQQPTLSFAARDGSGADLPDTSVYVDDLLVSTRLDDGKSHDLDPGKHAIRFVHAGKEQVIDIVVGSGEKGRTISATFGDGGDRASQAANATAKPRIQRPLGAKVLLGAGTGMLVGGAALGVIGVLQVPSNCSIGTNRCIAEPGDPSLHDASKAMQLTNIGWIVGGVGAAAIVGGVVWYYKGGKPPTERKQTAISPWLAPSGVGVALSGQL